MLRSDRVLEFFAPGLPPLKSLTEAAWHHTVAERLDSATRKQEAVSLSLRPGPCVERMSRLLSASVLRRRSFLSCHISALAFALTEVVSFRAVSGR